MRSSKIDVVKCGCLPRSTPPTLAYSPPPNAPPNAKYSVSLHSDSQSFDVSSRGCFSIGRSLSADIPLSSSIISRKHSLLYHCPDAARTFLVDLDSPHGTYLNGFKLFPFSPTELLDGHRLSFGPSGSGQAFFFRKCSKRGDCDEMDEDEQDEDSSSSSSSSSLAAAAAAAAAPSLCVSPLTGALSLSCHPPPPPPPPPPHSNPNQSPQSRHQPPPPSSSSSSSSRSSYRPNPRPPSRSSARANSSWEVLLSTSLPPRACVSETLPSLVAVPPTLATKHDEDKPEESESEEARTPTGRGVGTTPRDSCNRGEKKRKRSYSEVSDASTCSLDGESDGEGNDRQQCEDCFGTHSHSHDETDYSEDDEVEDVEDDDDDDGDGGGASRKDSRNRKASKKVTFSAEPPMFFFPVAVTPPDDDETRR